MISGFNSRQLGVVYRMIVQAQLNWLKEPVWLENEDNLIFVSSPDFRKTMVLCGLALEAINCEYTVCFDKMVYLIKFLDNCETDCAVGFWIKNLKRRPGCLSMMKLVTLQFPKPKPTGSFPLLVIPTRFFLDLYN